MNAPPAPRLSVVLVSYQSRADLERCLPSLYSEGHEAPEVIVVDNSPGDGTAAWLSVAFPAVRVLVSPGNRGYAGGNNLGIQAATGEYVLILNPDTEVHPGTLDALLEAVCAHPDALVTAKLLQPDGSLNACGLQMHYTGITSCRGLGEPSQAYPGLHPVPLLSGAAFIASKRVLERLGGFSESYFMYLEDVELSLRAKLLGFSLLCAGDAPITHHYTLGMSPSKFYYLERNRLLTLLRLYPNAILRQLVPALLLTECLTWAFALLNGPRYVWARARGYSWLWQQRSSWLQARRALQAPGVSTKTLFTGSEVELPLGQLVRSKAFARLLERLAGALYARAPIAPRGLR